MLGYRRFLEPKKPHSYPRMSLGHPSATSNQPNPLVDAGGLSATDVGLQLKLKMPPLRVHLILADPASGMSIEMFEGEKHQTWQWKIP